MKNSQEQVPVTTTNKLVRVISKTGVAIRNQVNTFFQPSYIDIVRQTSRTGMQDGLQFQPHLDKAFITGMAESAS